MFVLGYTTALQWLCLPGLRDLRPPGHPPARGLAHLLRRCPESAWL